MLNDNYIHPQSEVINELFRSRDTELIVDGPYQTGKSFPCMTKLHILHLYHPIWSLVVRKTNKALMRSVIPQYENKILPVHPMSSKSLVVPYGRRSPQWYDYPNGGRMVLGGMDDPDKVLSSEYDIVYYNQCEEGTLEDWEKLSARCNGRSGRWIENGMVCNQLLGDCNPSTPIHWIKKREKSNRLRLLQTKHKDNPTLYIDGEWTPQGVKTIRQLKDSLTGIRYQRGYQGIWVAAEGQVYEFNDNIHVIKTLPDLTKWQKYRAVDFGLKHPFVCLWFAKNPDNGALLCYREWRRTNWTVAEHAEKIKELSEGESISYTVADHDAEDNLTLNRAGIPTRLAEKSVLRGVEAVKLRLKNKRLLFYADALVEQDPELIRQGDPLDVIQEFPGYVHKPLDKHMGDPAKDDIPIKGKDDGLDASRYLVMSHDRGITLGFHSGIAKRNTRI